MHTLQKGKEQIRKVVMIGKISQVLEVLLDAKEPRIVHWDGRILRMHKLTSRKARQIFRDIEAYPGVLGVYNHCAKCQDLVDELSSMVEILP